MSEGAQGVVGHEQVRRLLEVGLPQVTLLYGPPSIGKWALAMHLADHHRVTAVDRFTRREFTADTVHALWDFVSRRPYGAYKLAVLDLTGSRFALQYRLLKLLEEPPLDVRFLLVSGYPQPAPVLVSRCTVYALSALNVAELRTVLIGQGMSGPVAERAAREGRGLVAPALARTTDAAMSSVLGLVTAIARRDADLFDRAIGETDQVTRDLLHRWLVEAMTGQRVLFTDADMHGMHHDQPRLREMLRRLSAVPAANARLGVRVALEPFLAP